MFRLAWIFWLVCFGVFILAQNFFQNEYFLKKIFFLNNRTCVIKWLDLFSHTCTRAVDYLTKLIRGLRLILSFALGVFLEKNSNIWDLIFGYWDPKNPIPSPALIIKYCTFLEIKLENNFFLTIHVTWKTFLWKSWFILSSLFRSELNNAVLASREFRG